ncbi:MAG TPA: HEAT repeat domain-containing protein [Bryobacteraceae bacterium]|nr:HEAT repeat domain-containing protein [Bryobacteraceae bacterium]
MKRFSALGVFLAVLLPVAAQTSDPEERIRIAHDLVGQGSAAIPRLQAMLTDLNTEVRVEAVKSIVEIGTQASLDPLIQATRDNDAEVLIRATDGLVNFYLPGYVRTGLTASVRRVGGAIKARFTDTNDVVIPRHLQARPEVVEALGKLARGGVSMDSRANAARAVGVLRGRAALPDLIEALHSKNDQVLYEGLIAIQKIRDPEAAPRIAFLLRDLDEKVQIAAIETTGLLANREALPQLRDVLTTTRKKNVRRAALTAIAMLPDPASRNLYTQYMSDKDDGLRAASAEGLARLKDRADLPAVEKAFAEEKKMAPRLADAFALVAFGRTEVSEFSPLQYLINSLNSSSWQGVGRAYLVELAREDAVRRAVEQAAPRGTRSEKVELAYVLSVSGDSKSVAVLDSLSRDGDSDAASAALTALKNLKVRLGS